MARVIEQMIVIKLSKLVKDDSGDAVLMASDTVSSLEEVVQTLVSEGTIAEIISE